MSSVSAVGIATASGVTLYVPPVRLYPCGVSSVVVADLDAAGVTVVVRCPGSATTAVIGSAAAG